MKLHGHKIYMFNFLRISFKFSKNGYIILHIHQQDSRLLDILFKKLCLCYNQTSILHTHFYFFKNFTDAHQKQFFLFHFHTA